MCGICGVLEFDRNRPVRRSTLEAMNRKITHRGPDEDGFYVSENVGLAMRRLSIIDLSTGHQPITNEDRSIWIVYNGEIYNYRELRQRLLEQGHSLHTHSDTETVVHLYEEYGRDCVKHLRGMFAFALWDERRRVLLLARDRLGIKPLYYRHSERNIIFGSEIKALLEFPGVEPEFNRSTLPEYLAFGYLSRPQTMFEGIQKLMPGHTAEIGDTGDISLRQYWDLPAQTTSAPRRESYYVTTYREMLEQCVSSHLMSDVPLGVFLSGGLDSSAIAALATKIRREPLETFSVGCDETAFSELPYARQVASHLGANHHEVKVSAEEFFEALPRLIWQEDEPITWPSSVFLYFVARLARQHVTVVLTGEGSDETLAGYMRYTVSLWNSRFDSAYRPLTVPALRKWVREAIAFPGSLPPTVQRKLMHTFVARDGESWASLYFENFLCAFTEPELSGLLNNENASQDSAYEACLEYWEQSSGDLLARMLRTDIKTYLVELLMKQDQMSMAASVESRVPFLDHALVEFALGIPSRLKTSGLAGKRILKSAIRDLLPSSIIDRKKMGFPTPWRVWLNGPLFPRVEELLLSPRSIDRGLFRPDAVRRLLNEHQSSMKDHSDRLWRLVNLELWQRACLDRDHELLSDIAFSASPRNS